MFKFKSISILLLILFVIKSNFILAVKSPIKGRTYTIIDGEVYYDTVDPSVLDPTTTEKGAPIAVREAQADYDNASADVAAQKKAIAQAKADHDASVSIIHSWFDGEDEPKLLKALKDAEANLVTLQAVLDYTQKELTFATSWAKQFNDWKLNPDLLLGDNLPKLMDLVTGGQIDLSNTRLPLLTTAIDLGDFETVAYLINRGANPNSTYKLKGDKLVKTSAFRKIVLSLDGPSGSMPRSFQKEVLKILQFLLLKPETKLTAKDFETFFRYHGEVMINIIIDNDAVPILQTIFQRLGTAKLSPAFTPKAEDLNKIVNKLFEANEFSIANSIINLYNRSLLPRGQDDLVVFAVLLNSKHAMQYAFDNLTINISKKGYLDRILFNAIRFGRYDRLNQLLEHVLNSEILNSMSLKDKINLYNSLLAATRHEVTSYDGVEAEGAPSRVDLSHITKALIESMEVLDRAISKGEGYTSDYPSTYKIPNPDNLSLYTF